MSEALPARAELLALVEALPAAAAAHDRDGWVGAFSDDARVEYPVGARPHTGRRDIERFYDTFIAPNRIRYHRDVDIVSGRTVMRDLTVELTTGSDLTLGIPAYLRYAIDDANRISELQAFWELPGALWRFIRSGRAAIPAGFGIGRELLVNQGPAGALGMVQGLRRRTGRADRARGDVLLAALAGGDQLAVRRMLGRTPLVSIGDDTPVALDELGRRLRAATWAKRIDTGGSSVVATCGADGRGVLLLDFDNGSGAVDESGEPGISRLRYYT